MVSREDPRFQALIARIDEKIKDPEVGWFAMSVGLTEKDPPEAFSFTYTIGLWRNYQHPELIITNLPSHTAHEVLDSAVDLIKAGTRIDEGRYSEILVDYDVEARQVATPNVRECLAWAANYYDSPRFAAVQLVWPDRERRFPWDEGFVGKQRLLGV